MSPEESVSLLFLLSFLLIYSVKTYRITSFLYHLQKGYGPLGGDWIDGDYNAVARAASLVLIIDSEGFECVTIEKITLSATVLISTIYSLFQSKRGALRALIDEVFPQDQFEAAVLKNSRERT